MNRRLTPSTLALLLAGLLLPAAPARADELSGTAKRMNRAYIGAAAGTSVGPSYFLNIGVGEAAGAYFTGLEGTLTPGQAAIANYPGTIANLAALTGNAAGQIRLQWTAPGGDGNLTTAVRYDVRVSSQPIPNQAAYAAVAPFSQSWVPQAPGGPESRVITGLLPGVTYYAAIEAVDGAGVHGYLSNIPSAMPPSVLGTVGYLGNQGGPIAVGVFVSTDFYNPAAFFDSRSQSYPGAYALGSFPFSTPFYVAGFVDMNKNGRPDSGEHFDAFGGLSTPTAVAVAPGTIRTGVDFVIAAGSVTQQSVVEGTVTYNGSAGGIWRVELHGEPFFTGTPIAVYRSTQHPGFYSVTVPGNGGFFVRSFVDQNGDAVLQPTEPSGVYGPSGQSVDQVFVAAFSTVTAIDLSLFDAGHDGGQGTAAVSPSTAAAGGLFSSTFTLRTGADAITAGGRIILGAPAGWGAFQTTCSTCAGYVSVTVQSTNTVSVALDAVEQQDFAPATVLSGSLNPGDTVYFSVTGQAVPCLSTTSAFGMATSQGAGFAPKALVSGLPSVQIVPGTPVSLSLLPAIPTLIQFVTSDQLLLNTLDQCGSISPVRRSTDVVVSGALYDFNSGAYTFDPTVLFSSNNASPSAAPLTLNFKIGRSSSPFTAASATLGNKSFQFDFNLKGSSESFYAPMDVLATAAISSAAVSTSSVVGTDTNVTITPNGDGEDDVAYITFGLGTPSLAWAVGIASAPWDATTVPVWTTSGRGAVTPGQLGWDGRANTGSRSGQISPIGTYYVRIAAGGSYDDTLSIGVLVGQISGQVTDAETLPVAALSGARVSAFGPIAAQTIADDNGRFVIAGLSTGTYTVTFSRSGYRPLAASADVPSSTETVVNGPLQRASLLLITPTLQAGATQQYEQRGRIVVHTPSWDRSYFSPIRLPAGSSVFDDGGQWDSVLQRTIVRTRFRFEVEQGIYVVEASLPGHVSVSTSVLFGAVGLSLTLPPFVPNADIAGGVSLSTATNPAPNPDGLTVTVQALGVSSAVLGGISSVFLPPGASSSAYVLKGVPPGSFTVTASAPGFASTSLGPVSVGTANVSGVDLPALTEGAVLVGTVTVNGDTTGLAALSGSSLTVSVALNAWSPTTYALGRSGVYVRSDPAQASAEYRMSGLLPGATYLVFARVTTAGGPNFDAGETLPRSVYVASGAATTQVNLTFERSSAALTSLLLLPPGTPDFTQVSVYGRIVASRDPFDAGTTFEYLDATTLPAFTAATTSATFALGNLRTGLVELTALYRATGVTSKVSAAVLGGSTRSVTLDLTSQTFTVSGRIIDHVSDPTFNTNAKLVSAALYEAPAGYPAGISSTTARIEAIRRDFGDLNAALPTATFDAARTRVGFLTAAGTYTVTGLTPGVYLLRTLPLKAFATGQVVVPSQDRLITVTSASLTGVDLTLTDGFTVAGNIILDNGIQDAVELSVELLNGRGDVVASTATALGSAGGGLAANSVPFSFTRVPAGGFYTLRVRDTGSPARYVAQPVLFPNPTISPTGLQGERAGLDIQLKRAATAIGRLRDANTGTLIAANNATLLPAGFSITALANPFLQGGFTTAASSASGRPIENDGTFRLGPLFPGVPYDFHLEQQGWDIGFLGDGSQNYMPTVLAGVTLQPGQVLDLGVVDLRQGDLLTGVVTSTAGTRLANVPIKAVPSFVRSPVTVRTQTDPDGVYRLWVSSSVSRYYDITAAPRDAAGSAYQEQTRRNIDLTRTGPVDFTLPGLGGTVIGRVITADNLPLTYPFGSQKGFPAAAVFLQPFGTLPETNLFGDITAQTMPDGTFLVAGLSTGTYTLRAASLGYAFASTTITVDAGLTDAGDLLLALGGTVRGDITKQDPNSPTGFSCPNDREVSGVAAADAGFNEFVIGTVEVDPLSLSVCHYAITGFKAGVRYQLALLDASGDAVFPNEGVVSFTSGELRTTKAVNLTFRPSPVDCFATGKSLGDNRLALNFRCSKPLRNLTEPDNDLTLLLARSSSSSDGTALRFPDGTGAFPLADRRIAENRRELTAIYRPAVGEGRFSVKLSAFSSFVDPKTGAEFHLDKTFDFFTGLQAVKSQEASNVSGVNIGLEAAADEEERSGVVCGPGAFVPEGQDQAPTGLQLELGMQKAETRSQSEITAARRRMALTTEELSALSNPRAVPDLIAQARTALAGGQFRLTPAGQTGPAAAKHPPYVNPLSSFYNILLPAGIKHNLNDACRVRLSYELALSSSANPTQLNVWFFNPLTNQYELEDGEKTIDTTNQTITVSVDHFSVYVVLASTPVAESTNPYSGGDLSVFNFPNPFNLEPKTKTLNVSAGGGAFTGGGASVTTEGTIIRAGVPKGLSGPSSIRIFDVAGELVRTYDLGTLTGNTGTGGTWYYFEWDGRNQSGSKVASGLYIGELKVAGKRKMWKMAVIKDARYK